MRALAPDPDVLVVGGGPAGSTLAGLLALEGVDVLLVDRARFPREKACGECVNPGAVAILRRTGLLGRVRETGPFPLEGWDLRTPEGKSCTARFPGGVDRALGVRRGPFDAALLGAARDRGIRVLEGVLVHSVDPDGERPVVRGRWAGSAGNEWTIRPRLVVGADGLRSVVARASGALARSPRRIKASLSWHLTGPVPDRPVGRLLLGGPLTSGLAPVATDPRGEGRAIWSQTVVVDPSRHGERLRRDPEGLRREAMTLLVPKDTGDPAAASADGSVAMTPLGPPRASGPFDAPTRWAAKGPVVLVGDAAGYFDPLTGQGIFRALRSAELAAPLILRALSTDPLSRHALETYDHAVRTSFEPGRRLQQVIDRALDHPLPRNAAVAILTRFPDAGDTLIAITGDRLPVRSLATGAGWSRDRPPASAGRSSPPIP